MKNHLISEEYYQHKILDWYNGANKTICLLKKANLSETIFHPKRTIAKYKYIWGLIKYG